LTLIHRRGTFRAHEKTLQQVLESRCRVMPFYELETLHGDDRVNGATVFDNRDGTRETFAVDAVVLGLGFLANLGPIKEWGLDLVRNGIVVDPSMRTNLPGVYAVGDITHYDGKLKLIATATAEAAVAVNYAKNYIDPKAKVSPGHSSERKD
jgi:thioredoxin reductase (NADPH)